MCVYICADVHYFLHIFHVIKKPQSFSFSIMFSLQKRSFEACVICFIVTIYIEHIVAQQ